MNNKNFSLADTIYDHIFSNNVQNINNLLSTSINLLFSCLNADSGTLWLKSHDALECVMTFSNDVTILLNSRIDQNAGLAGVVNKYGKALFVSNICSDEDAIFKDLFENSDLKSYLGCPIFIEKKLKGIISFYYNQAYNFNQFDIDLINCFCNFLGLAILDCSKDMSKIDEWCKSLHSLTYIKLNDNNKSSSSKSNKFFCSLHLDYNLPKNIQHDTLNNIVNLLNSLSEYSTSNKIAETLNISISTVRRYLNYLQKNKLIDKNITYSKTGHPTYTWKLK